MEFRGAPVSTLCGAHVAWLLGCPVLPMAGGVQLLGTGLWFRVWWHVLNSGCERGHKAMAGWMGWWPEAESPILPHPSQAISESPASLGVQEATPFPHSQSV